jgi:two-component system, sensor histidine kinase and response regulator
MEIKNLYICGLINKKFMGRVLVIISNSDLKKKILSLSSKIKGSDFFFFSDIEDFIDDFQSILPDTLIVGDKEFRTLVDNIPSHALVHSVNKFILAGHDPQGTLPTSDLSPIVLQSGFDIAGLEELIANPDEFNIQGLGQGEPLKWVFDNLPVGLFWKDLNHKYLGCNKVFADDQGISGPGAVIGLSDYDLFPKHLADDYVRKDLELINNNDPAACYEESGSGQVGSSEILWKRKILIRDDSGNVTGIMGMYEKVTEERKREAELLNKSRYMQMLMDNIPDTIYFKDRDCKFIMVNKAQAKALGVQRPEDAVGKSDYDFFDKAHSLASFNDEQDMMRTGTPVLNKLEHVGAADGFRYVTATKIPLTDNNGEIVGIAGVSRDVTKSHSLEMKLQQETNLLNALLDNVPDLVYFKDRKSQFTRISRSWLKKHKEADADNVIGKTDADYFSSEFAGEAYQDEQKLMQTGEPLINKLEKNVDATGKHSYILANKVPILDQDNEVVGMVGISRDITEFKNAEFKLTKEKELLQSLMDNIPDTIYFKDLLSRFTRINKAQAICMGLQSPEEAVGKTDFDFFPGEHANLAFRDEQELMKSGVPLINQIEKITRADGGVIWVSATKIPIKDQSGKITGFVGISRDVTEIEEARKNLDYAKAKAEEANKAKSLFLANMSHEIRTPMNGVIGMSDVLGQTTLTDEQREYLNIITKSGNSLLSIINNILDFSKIESGSLELEKAPINIRQVIENVADVLITSASNKGVDLVNFVDSSIPEIVEGDSVRLSQILINLVNNALKFTEHGEVYFTAELTESTEITFKVLFKVKDNGIGISKDAQQKIFQSFTQVDSSTTRKYGGTGLGLAISKRLVEMMGGEIGVESVEGEGSLFWFTAKFGVCAEAEPAKQASKLLIDGLRVLIVDDNRTNRFVFGKYLETWNCKYDQAENGAIALRMLSESAERKIPYDVALIDFQMEKMDGLKLAERIQENPQISSTRLILLSSVTDVIPRSEVQKYGFKYFLNKPIKLKELYDVISSITGNNESEKLKLKIDSEGLPSKLRVLVAEDNPTNLKVAQLILKPFVTSFDSAVDGLIAFEKFKANKYDIIFMDVQMPVMNGYEATRSIRDYEAENNLTPMKIVAMTANAMKEDVEECFNSGMDEYLSKPFRRDDVFKIIERLNLHKN